MFEFASLSTSIVKYVNSVDDDDDGSEDGDGHKQSDALLYV